MTLKLFKASFLIITAILIISGSVASWWLFGPMIRTQGGDPVSVYLPEGININAVTDTLKTHDLIRHPDFFRLLAVKKNYPAHIRAGHYIIRDKTSYNHLINILRGGIQTPVKVTFTYQRSLAQLAGTISRQLAFDSLSLMTFIKDQSFCRQLGFDTNTITAVFIPNTYELYWNTSPGDFMKRMKREYDKFWTTERKAAAEKTGLTPVEVISLASIVEEETWHSDEMPVIAGVYLNRLKKGMRLQADPTVKYAVGDITKKRILKKDLQINSPYNTYRFAGLPPGPITIPSIQAIDAVLHADQHNYLYFCAKEDFSGTHYFSKTLKEHNRYAFKYRQALNKNRVYH